MTTLQKLKARFTKVPVLAAVLVAGTVGGYAAQQYMGDDCCYPGAPCCHPGAACCARHHHAKQ